MGYYHQGLERRKRVPLVLCRLAQPRLYIMPSRSVEIRTNRGTAIPWFVNTTPSTHRIPTTTNIGSCTETECTRTLVHGTHDAEFHGHAGSPSQIIVFCAHVDCKTTLLFSHLLRHWPGTNTSNMPSNFTSSLSKFVPVFFQSPVGH